MQKERIHWIDIARGIAIIFVIYAHVLGGNGIRYLFYAFHIPLFFFLSGILHKQNESFITFFKKSAKRLLIPYLIFAFLMFALWFFNLKNHTLSPEVIRQFLSIFYGNSNNGLMAFNNNLWFLPTLFITRVLFATIIKIYTKTKSIFLNIFFFSVLGYVISVFLPNLKLPFGIETAFSAVAFYGTGFLWQNSNTPKNLVIKYKYLLFPLLLILGCVLATVDFHNYRQQIDMRLNHMNNYFYFYFNAFAGIFAWIAFSMILKKNNLLEIIGRNTLSLFAWHPIVYIYLAKLFSIDTVANIAKNIKTFIPLLYTVISVSFILFAKFIIIKFRSAHKIPDLI